MLLLPLDGMKFRCITKENNKTYSNSIKKKNTEKNAKSQPVAHNLQNFPNGMTQTLDFPTGISSLSCKW